MTIGVGLYEKKRVLAEVASTQSSVSALGRIDRQEICRAARPGSRDGGYPRITMMVLTAPKKR